MNKFNHAYYNKILKEADSKGGTIYEIYLLDSYIKELPDFFKDLTVTDTFHVNSNMLTSCKNFPKHVGKRILANYNRIESLEGLQNIPSEKLGFVDNNLKSLEYLSPFSGYISLLELNNNKLKSFKGLQNLNIKELRASYNLISSWNYVPKGTHHLSVRNNKLTSWKGMPENLISLRVSFNWNVQDFNGYREVNDFLSLSSNLWNTVPDVRRQMQEDGISPPHDINVYGENEQI